nr:MAG TPA: hypothetical protein [Bacteriophage sp.]
MNESKNSIRKYIDIKQGPVHDYVRMSCFGIPIQSMRSRQQCYRLDVER